MNLGPEYEDDGRMWQNVLLWAPGDVLPTGWQYARNPGEWQNGRRDPGTDIMVGVPYRVPAIKAGPNWDDVVSACRTSTAVEWIRSGTVRFRTPELALKAIRALDPPTCTVVEKPEVSKMTLGPPYEDGGKWWQDVISVRSPVADKHTRGQYRLPLPTGSGKWITATEFSDVSYKFGWSYRIPAKSPQMAPEAPVVKAVALPMTLVPTSPEPPYGSVVVCGSGHIAHQRSRGYGDWVNAHGSGHSRKLSEMLEDSPPVVLIYVPPVTEESK